jgi:hypothetical protein
MRAEIHDGPDPNTLHQRPDTLMHDRNRQLDEILLQRTAGPYKWVKTPRSQPREPRLPYPYKLPLPSVMRRRSGPGPEVNDW